MIENHRPAVIAVNKRSIPEKNTSAYENEDYDQGWGVEEHGG